MCVFVHILGFTCSLQTCCWRIDPLRSTCSLLFSRYLNSYAFYTLVFPSPLFDLVWGKKPTLCIIFKPKPFQMQAECLNRRLWQTAMETLRIVTTFSTTFSTLSAATRIFSWTRTPHLNSEGCCGVSPPADEWSAADGLHVDGVDRGRKKKPSSTCN